MQLEKIVVLSFLTVIGFNAGLPAQQPLPGEEYYSSLLHKTFDTQNVMNTVTFVERYFRIAGNTGFDSSIYFVENILKAAGFKKEVNNEFENGLTYRIERRPMRRPTWEPVDASLTIDEEETPLLSFRTNRNMIAINSASTPAAGVKAEVVYCGTASDSEMEKHNVRGKILFAEARIDTVYAQALKYGAVGAIAYSIPFYNEPEKHPNGISFLYLPYNEKHPEQQKWGIMLSFAARTRLLAALARGPVTADVHIQTKIYPSTELTLVANVRGTIKPGERMVINAHVQEPGANDNATGVATLAEMARMTALFVTEGKIKPARTITFLWGDEIVAPARYIRNDSARAKSIKWGLSLDMVGEDTKKTGGVFLIEKMPDPSAIWTRGADKHTDWGGEPMLEKDMFPHYFNDFLFDRCRHEAKSTGWKIAANPYEGGSDHTPFLEAKIPAALMWHFTDVFYHTDEDRLDKVSAQEMKHVGVSGMVTAYLLTASNERMAVAAVKEIGANALQRLSTEFKLSRQAILNGKPAENEKHIIDTWRDWYVGAIDRCPDINVGGMTPAIKKAVKKAANSVNVATKKYLRQL
jgi:hypothetical protein